MKRTTSALLAGALATGGTVLLSVAVPGVASAGACGTTTVDQFAFEDWDQSQTRSAGSNTVVEGGLHVVTTPSPPNNSQSKAAAYYDVDVLLSSQTAASNYGLAQTLNSGSPKAGYNLKVDLDGAGPRPAQYLVNEDGLYGGNWWSNTAAPGVPAGNGYPASAPLQKWSAEYPDAVIQQFGYSLGSGVVADVTIDSITFGCNVFEFDYANQAPTAAFTVNDAGDNKYRTYAFVDQSSDPDGDTLTYAWDFGDGTTSTEANPTHTFASTGSYSVTLTVTDPGGLTGTSAPWVVTVALPAETVQDEWLPNTGAGVIGLAAVGGLALVGGGTGVALSRRRNRTA
ncbi:PKD domain-containing protein [Blastococcus litoris]|uniref:PKD domain-containing protein n=1 Tax=Blastococcus litoris TaxID=2171622 RepID=UPI000E303746|nr:PKD domain-containing protein [Blastococcus litoris]